jgi:hypothetical protein
MTEGTVIFSYSRRWLRLLYMTAAGMAKRFAARWRRIALLLGLVLPNGISVNAAATVAEARGGSNYAWSDMDGCSRSKFGVVAFYDKQKARVDKQLSQMYRNGQRRLAVDIFFMHGGASEVADSTGGNLDQRYTDNLAAYLRAVKNAGFEEILIKFLPQGPNNVFYQNHEWPEWREDLYNEHFSVIKNLRPIVMASRLRYRLDLYSEAIPTRMQPMFLRFTQRLWADYTAEFGKSDTVGFAIIPNIRQDRFATIPAVYGNNVPEVLDLHFYRDAYSIFINAHNRLVQIGYGNLPWIIGEAYYDDGGEADELVRAIRDTGQPVVYLLQWPLSRANENDCPGVDIAPPTQFDQYIGRGF